MFTGGTFAGRMVKPFKAFKGQQHSAATGLLVYIICVCIYIYNNNNNNNNKFNKYVVKKSLWSFESLFFFFGRKLTSNRKETDSNQ